MLFKTALSIHEDPQPGQWAGGAAAAGGPSCVCVTIEVPRGSFIKRDGHGAIAFVSPLPCPFNYGSVRGLPAGDADWRDAVVLGPRLARGTRIRIPVRGVVGFLDAGAEDCKLICGHAPLCAADRVRVMAFFRAYAACKRVLNLLQARPGATACCGWCALPGGGPPQGSRF